MAKFKVGDRVRVLDNNNKRKWLKPLSGKEATVEKVFKCANDDIGCYDIGEDYIIPEEQLEFVTKFKVGDKVRIIADHSPGQAKKRHIGECLTITKYKDSRTSNYGRDTYSFDENIFAWFDDELELVKENNMFSKKDLKEFDVVKLRNGEVLMVLRNDRSRDGLAIFNKEGYGCKEYMHNYNDDLTYYVGSRSEKDIVAVKKFDGKYIYSLMETFFDSYKKEKTYNDPNFTWDWERKDVEEMTLAEVCKALGKEIKIVKE